MKALVFKRSGGPDQAMLAEIPGPVLEPDKILVGVHAGGLNYAVDNVTRAGKMKTILRGVRRARRSLIHKGENW